MGDSGEKEFTEKKEIYEEPTCELVEFSFENILTAGGSNDLEDDYF